MRRRFARVSGYRWRNKNAKRKYRNYKRNKKLNYLARVVRPDTKYWDNGYTQNAITTTPGILCLNADIDQGDTSTTRIGRKILVLDCFIKGLLTFDEMATASQVRVILFKNHDTKGASASASSLLNDTSVEDILVSPRNMQFITRFKVLYDRLFTLCADKPNVRFKIYKKVFMPVLYSGTGNGITDIVDYSLNLLLVSNESVNSPDITMSARLRYSDS